MRIFRFAISTSVTVALVLLLQTRMGSIPPIGTLLDPFAGFWQNAESTALDWPETLAVDGLSSPVEVVYDDRLVPHIFAQNDEDLYFTQGYVEARHRLWQMDFMSRLASGQLAEVIGNSVLNIDRYFRRLGMPKAIEEAWALIEKDPQARSVMLAYTKGVNTYIQSLSPRDYPLEFKLLDYAPSNWTPTRSMAVFKLMSFNLVGYDDDVETTNALLFFGKKDFDKLYNHYPPGYDPIIPDTFYNDMQLAQIDTGRLYETQFATAWLDAFRPAPQTGSNNWAVHGSRTASGYPMLANDPHLGLNLPAIWYEQQHHAPGVNAYGVSIPGIPMITLGFNDKIAWGFTNAGRDVKDWYRLTISEDGQSYLFADEYRPFIKRPETIAVQGESTVVDTVLYTHYGPVTFDSTYPGTSDRVLMALRWKAHDPSNEISAAYDLNRATDYDEYKSAIAPFTTPGQNMVFADRQGDIAITQQGTFPVLWPEQGRFIGDGADPRHQWQAMIPNDQNPYHRNPERGFVSSANQVAAHANYPYYYSGNFQHFRNKRINDILAADSSITLEDMQALQNDNYNLKAAMAWSILLPYWEEATLNSQQEAVIEQLSNWDFYTHPDAVGAVYWDAYWQSLQSLCFDELQASKAPILQPDDYNLLLLMTNEPNHWLFDIDSTATKETLPDLTILALDKAAKQVNEWQEQEDRPLTWANWKNTTMSHWLKSIPAFNLAYVPVGGDRDIVNANSATHGASWRLIAHLKPEGVEAYGIYAGGQSGNPGSPYYGQFVDKWAAGEYYPLLLLAGPDAPNDRIVYRQTFE